MMFNVHRETPETVQGYLVPNSFSGQAAIVVTWDGRTVYEGSCDQILVDVVKAGRHETGQVGFVLDDGKIPGFGQPGDLCVFDKATGLLIYRRNDPDMFVQKRAFRLETSIGAPIPYHAALAPYFAYGLGDVHLYGYETVGQLFNLHNYPSMYFEGRVHIRPHQRYLNDELCSMVSVLEPYVALALLLDGLSAQRPDVLGQLEDREYAALMPVAATVDGLHSSQPETICRRLKSAPRDVLNGLESPLVGLLTGTTPGVGGARRDVAQAIDILSHFDVIIPGEAPAQSHRDIVDALGLPATALPDVALPQAIYDLADALRTVRTLETLLENDLVVYHCLEQSMSGTPHDDMQ